MEDEPEPAAASCSPRPRAARPAAGIAIRAWRSPAPTKAASSADDEILTAEEAAPDLHGCGELVTPSACNTGAWHAARRREPPGLRRSFHLAGARTTITALWRVADDATRELMVFYRCQVHDHATKADALRGAQLEMLQRNRERHGGRGLPGTWGAFLLEGDWR
ncbi:MAG: CHAT domain-containing protein [Planctomycetota bacterium]